MADEQRISVLPAMCVRGLLLIGLLLVFLGALFAVPEKARIWIVLGMGAFAVGDGAAILWLAYYRPQLFARAEPPARGARSVAGASTRDVEALRGELGERLATLEGVVSELASQIEQLKTPPASARRRRK